MKGPWFPKSNQWSTPDRVEDQHDQGCPIGALADGAAFAAPVWGWHRCPAPAFRRNRHLRRSYGDFPREQSSGVSLGGRPGLAAAYEQLVRQT